MIQSRISRRRGLFGLELLVVVSIIAILIGLLLPAVQRLDSAADGLVRDFPAIEDALHGYHEDIVGTRTELLGVLFGSLRSRTLSEDTIEDLRSAHRQFEDASAGLEIQLAKLYVEQDNLRGLRDRESLRKLGLVNRAISATVQTHFTIGVANSLIGLLVPAVQVPPPREVQLNRPQGSPAPLVAALIVRWQMWQINARAWSQHIAARYIPLAL